MTFGLGVDLGTTFTAAAVSRSGRPEMVNLGERSPAIPSVVMIREDGTSIVGDAAAPPGGLPSGARGARGEAAPRRPHPAHPRWRAALGRPDPVASPACRGGRGVAREGRRPDGIVLTHPANWGPYKRELFDSVPRLADLTAVSWSPSRRPPPRTTRPPRGWPRAPSSPSTTSAAAPSTPPCCASSSDGFEFLGPPEGIEGLGGIDFDEAVFAHVDRSLDGALSELDLDDPPGRRRAWCGCARTACSPRRRSRSTPRPSMPVMLPDLHTEVRLTRGEFEEMIRAPIEATVVGAAPGAGRRPDVAPEHLERRAARRRVLPHPAGLADALRRARPADGGRHPPEARGGPRRRAPDRAPPGRGAPAGHARAGDAGLAALRPAGGPAAGSVRADAGTPCRASAGTRPEDSRGGAGRPREQRHRGVQGRHRAAEGAGDGLLRARSGGRPAVGRSGVGGAVVRRTVVGRPVVGRPVVGGPLERPVVGWPALGGSVVARPGVARIAVGGSAAGGSTLGALRRGHASALGEHAGRAALGALPCGTALRRDAAPERW